MHKNYKLDEQVITNFKHRHIKPIKYQKKKKSLLRITQTLPKLS